MQQPLVFALIFGLAPGWFVAAADETADLNRAETLLAAAEKGELTDALATEAAALLAHGDPFVRALAEWAIATRVERDNAGEQVVWPRADLPLRDRNQTASTSSPVPATNGSEPLPSRGSSLLAGGPDAPWFVAWRQLAGDRQLEADYARQAIVWGLHRDSRGLLGSAEKIVRRAAGVAAEIESSTVPAAAKAEVASQVEALRALRDQLAASVTEAPQDLAKHRRLWLAMRHAARPVVLANPAVDFGQLLFVTQHSAHTHRNITGSQYPWVHKPGGDICLQRGLDPGQDAAGVLGDRLGPGHVHGVDLWWDADRVVFGYARQPAWPPAWETTQGDYAFRLRHEQEPTHIFEIRLDGTEPRQLTDHPHFSDFEPTYCANGDVVFVSERSGRSSECGKFTADHTVLNLYAVTPGQENVRRLNDNKDIDRYPHSLDNGLIAYTRWEYQERHFFETHAIWTMRPDGTMADAVFNQHLRAPFGLRDTRSVPGGNQLVSIATGHHTFAHGPVVVIDPDRGINSETAIRIVTPYVVPEEGPMAGRPVAEGGVPDRGGLYQTPWALSERCFLASYSYARAGGGKPGSGNAAGFAIYLIDVYGNKELIHRDPLLSSVSPVPLRPRPRPLVVPPTGRQGLQPNASYRSVEVDRSRWSLDLGKKLTIFDISSTVVPAENWATTYVSDVYHDLPGIGRGTVKYLRISQRVGWPLDDKIGAMRYIPGNAWEYQFGHWSWAPVRVIGEVDVAADGSAYFRVPADTALYFQALDERHMEIRRMRSHVTFQPGECRGCVGCHESQLRTPAAAWPRPLALDQPPQIPRPPSWGADKLLGYEWLVQPVLDRHCVRCHGAVEPDGGLDFTSTKRGRQGRNQRGAAAPVGNPAETAANSWIADGGDGFNQSFCTMFGRLPGLEGEGRRLVSAADRLSGASVTQPMQFGSHRSPLVRVLLDDQLHRDEVRLSDDEWRALVTWVDANAPYHDQFYNRRPADGGAPRRDVRVSLPAD